MRSIQGKEGGRNISRNVGVLQQHYTTSQTRRPQLESPPI